MSDRDVLLTDAMNALTTLRSWLMTVAENHPDMDSSALDDLLRRWKELEEEDR